MPTRERPIPVGFGVAQIVFTCSGDSRTPEITFGFQAISATDPNAMATSIMTAWTAKFVPAALASTWSVSKVMTSVHLGSGIIDGLDGSPSAGTASFNAASLAVCMLLRKQTALGGRKNRGRCYLPAGYLGELSVDQAGVIDPTLVGATTTRWTDFIDQLATDDLPMMLIHSGPVGGPFDDPTGVDTGFCESMVATQRRRQRKVGRGRRA
jgi:hypothetical protein